MCILKGYQDIELKTVGRQALPSRGVELIICWHKCDVTGGYPSDLSLTNTTNDIFS